MDVVKGIHGRGTETLRHVTCPPNTQACMPICKVSWPCQVDSCRLCGFYVSVKEFRHLLSILIPKRSETPRLESDPRPTKDANEGDKHPEHVQIASTGVLQTNDGLPMMVFKHPSSRVRLLSHIDRTWAPILLQSDPRATKKTQRPDGFRCVIPIHEHGVFAS